MTDPHLWWYVTRASALIAWALMTLSVLWGILLSTRVLRRADNPSWLRDSSGLGKRPPSKRIRYYRRKRDSK